VPAYVASLVLKLTLLDMDAVVQIKEELTQIGILQLVCLTFFDHVLFIIQSRPITLISISFMQTDTQREILRKKERNRKSRERESVQ
jgi:hypothetical protein